MSDLTAYKINEIGPASSKDTMATIIMHRMAREAELEMIFKALGLVRGRDTAQEAVEIIQTLLQTFTKYEELTK